MKRLIIAAMALLTICQSSLLAAQEQEYAYKSDEVSLTYGRASIPGIAMGFGVALGTVFTAGLFRADEFKLSGAIGAEYFHYFNEHFSVGGDMVFEQSKIIWESYNGKDSSGNSVYRPGNEANTIFLTLMPGVKYRWLYRPKFGMYSKACIGGMLCISPSYVTMEETTDQNTGNKTTTSEWHEGEVSVSPAVQLCLLGMEWGGRIGGFTELGIGMQGIIQVGIRYRF